jgi:hypothetical protein
MIIGVIIVIIIKGGTEKLFNSGFTPLRRLAFRNRASSRD